MLKPWPWLRTALDHGTRQQVTRLGLLFTLTCVLVSLAAFVSANNLLFLILALLLATWMVSGFIGRLSLAGLELDFLLPEHLCAGRKLDGAGGHPQHQALDAVVLYARGRFER